MKKQPIIHKELSCTIVGAAMEVHRELGCGFLESVYDEAFGLELAKTGVSFEYQEELPIHYKHERLGKQFRADYIVEGAVIIENKATRGDY